MKPNEHLDRIKRGITGGVGASGLALESLTALREITAALEHRNLTQRRRIHLIERHNQFFERCESGWCNPSTDADPASRDVGVAWKTPAECEDQITALREHCRELEGQRSVVTATLNASVFAIVEQLRAQVAAQRGQIAALEAKREETAWREPGRIDTIEVALRQILADCAMSDACKHTACRIARAALSAAPPQPKTGSPAPPPSVPE